MFTSTLRKLKKRLRTRWFSYWCTRNVAVRGTLVCINSPVSLNRNTHLGNNVHMNGLRIEGNGKVVIGDNFHSGVECLFLTEFHNYEGAALPYDSTTIRKDITIEANVWIGSRVIILGGVTIGEGAIIQAGSCVVNDIPRCGIAGGHPAKVFKHRDIEHYERLKREKKFH